MISNGMAVLRWLSVIVLRFLQAEPVSVVASVVASLFSQVFQIAAFLLPLKVMILLGSHGVPNYFPSIFASFEREQLILLLALAAVMLYVCHLLMDFVGVVLAKNSSLKLASLNNSDEASSKQKKNSLSLFSKITTILSGFVFSILVLFFLAVYRPITLVVVLVFSLSAILLVEMFIRFSLFFNSRGAFKFARVVDIFSASGFLIVFGCLVIEFLYGGTGGILLGILTLLLCRQMFNRVAMVVKNIERVYRDREKLLASLPWVKVKHSKVHKEDDAKKAIDVTRSFSGNNAALIKPGLDVEAQVSYWDMVCPSRSGAMLNEMLAARKMSLIEAKQLDAGSRGQLLLSVVARNSDSTHVNLLFRLFHRNQFQQALHAAELLEVYPAKLSPGLLLASEYNGFAAHLYCWPAHAIPVIDPHALAQCRQSFFRESSGWVVPRPLQQSKRHSTLVDRCNLNLWLRCQAFSRWMDDDIRSMVDAFVDRPERLSQALSTLPLRLYNPDIAAGHVYLSESGYSLTWWGRWRLEPIGSAWPLELGFERLEHVFEELYESCNDLRSFSVSHIKLAALAFVFEANCAEGAYIAAFSNLKSIVDVLDRLGI